MELPFILAFLSWILVGWGVSIPFGVWVRRRAMGVPFRYVSIKPVDAQTPFPRSLFRMEGQTGGPVPMKAPLSGRDCYYYEVIFHHQGSSGRKTELLKNGRAFTFFSPKGAVTLNPLEFTLDPEPTVHLENGSRYPLPLVVREKMNAFGLAGGSIEEKIIPSYKPIQLVGRVGHHSPGQFRVRKGPGLFPLISVDPTAIRRLSADGVVRLTTSKALTTLLLLFLGFTGLYFSQAYLLSLL